MTTSICYAATTAAFCRSAVPCAVRLLLSALLYSSSAWKRNKPDTSLFRGARVSPLRALLIGRASLAPFATVCSVEGHRYTRCCIFYSQVFDVIVSLWRNRYRYVRGKARQTPGSARLRALSRLPLRDVKKMTHLDNY